MTRPIGGGFAVAVLVTMLIGLYVGTCMWMRGFHPDVAVCVGAWLFVSNLFVACAYLGLWPCDRTDPHGPAEDVPPAA